MGDRTYVWLAIPVTALAMAGANDFLVKLFNGSKAKLDAVLAFGPEEEESIGEDGFTVRLVDAVPCLIWEDLECNYGGNIYEEELRAFGLPYLHYNRAGKHYGPRRSASRGNRHATVRCDHHGDPIASVGMVDGRAVACVEDLADLETYARLRADVLGLPSV